MGLIHIANTPVTTIDTQLEGDVSSMKLKKIQAKMSEVTKLLGVLEGELKQCRKDL